MHDRGEIPRGYSDWRPHPPPRRQGMSTGAKIAIGCGVVVLLIIIAGAALFFYVQRVIERESGGEEAHLAATETYERLAAEHPFTPPTGNTVSVEQVETFFAVTEEVWSEAGVWAAEVNQALSTARDQDDLGALVDAFRAMPKLMRMRLLLAESLDRHDMSSEEFAWIGDTLLEAYRALDGGPVGAIVPETNLELARAYRERLAGFVGGEGLVGKDWILLMAGAAVERPDIRDFLDE